MLKALKSFFSKNINIIMFLTLSLSWGFSWFCGKYQINTEQNPINIFPEISAAYRFILAAIFLSIVYIPIKKPRLLPNKSELRIVLVYSLFSFCLNFFIFYYAIYKMVTGINAIVFSLSIIFNHILAKFVFKTKKDFNWRFYVSSFVGIFGLFLILLPKLTAISVGINTFIGLCICVVATLSYCFGSTFYESKSAQIKADPIMVFIWCLIGGFCYATLIGFVHSLVVGKDFVFIANFNPNFTFSLFYLAVPATAIGYLCGMLLIKNIGSVKASYTTLISPTIAMFVTAMFEDYKFTIATLIGILLISFSKLIMFYKKG